MSFVINKIDFDELFDLARIKIFEVINGSLNPEDLIDKESNLLIVSEGTPFSTQVYVHGKLLGKVRSVEISEIDYQNPPMATITVYHPEIHIRCNGSINRAKVSHD